MELAATSSPAPPSVWSCCAEGTKCEWRFHPIWLASSSRPGFPRSPTVRIRRSRWSRSRISFTTRSRSRIRLNLVRDGRELFVEGWAEMSRTLTSLADGADLLVTGQTYHGVVANVAEYYDIPVAGLHHFPVRVNGQIGLPFLPSPAPVVRSTLRALGGCIGASPRTTRTHSAVNWACRGQRPPRRNGWPNVGRSKSRPTTRLVSGTRGGVERPATLRRRADDGVADGCRR